MRILFHTTSPLAHSGYGNVCKELVTRLRKQGHFIRIATKHGFQHWQRWVDHERVGDILHETQTWVKKDNPKKITKSINNALKELEGIEIFEGTNIAILNEMLEAEKFDYLFSLWDIWKLHGKRQPIHDKWVAYVPIDTEWIADVLRNVCLGKDPHPPDDTTSKGPSLHIAMSKHGVKELRSIGLEPMYAPHGVNTKVFRPNLDGRKAFRKDMGWTDDDFVIGSVGLNYGDDRKGFIPLMRAFKEFEKKHIEAKLYIHTHVGGKYPGTVDYIKIADKIGVSRLYFPHQGSNDIGRIDKEWLNDVYNGMDVFCLPTRGEGFGIPIIEAQACGTPVITTDTTTGKELTKTGWLIDTKPDHLRYIPGNCFRYEVGEEGVLKCLELAYNAWKYTDYRGLRKVTRENILEFDWDTIWKKHWKPIFKLLEEKLKEKK